MPFDCYIRKGVEQDKTIIWEYVLTDEEMVRKGTPEKPLKSIETLKRTLPPLFFAGQIMNDPMDDGLMEFKREWITAAKLQQFPNLVGCPTVMSVDPAVRLKETNDYTGIVVTKIAPTRHVYIFEAMQKRLSPEKLVEEVFKLVDLYQVTKVLLETQVSQIVFMSLFKAEMIKRNKFFSIEEVNNSTKETKAMRIRALVSYYANGMIFHKFGLTDLEDQLLQFPRNAHDDIIDALAQQVPYWKSVPLGTPIKNPAPEGSLNWWKKKIPANSSDRFTQLFGDLIKGRHNG